MSERTEESGQKGPQIHESFLEAARDWLGPDADVQLVDSLAWHINFGDGYSFLAELKNAIAQDAMPEFLQVDIEARFSSNLTSDAAYTVGQVPAQGSQPQYPGTDQDGKLETV